MTWPLMGRLFGVPLLIVSLIVGGAVAVVLLFGSLTSSKERSVDELLTVLEQSHGEASLGVLLPREKELWQKAVELGLRLKKSELKPEEMDVVVARVTALVSRDLADLKQATEHGTDRVKGLGARWDRLRWLIVALGQTQRVEAAPVLIEVVGCGKDPYRGAAMQQLANLGAREAVEPIVATLSQSPSDESRLIACAALSVLAKPGDSRVIEALADVRSQHEGEIAWGAALALARLGSDQGRLTLLDMLDRAFWETGKRYRVVDEKGNLLSYDMPADRVEAYLIEAIDASSRLSSKDLWDSVERLKSDSSALVRQKAVEALAGRTSLDSTNANQVESEPVGAGD